MDTLDWLITQYFPNDTAKTEPVPFGLTNTTCFVSVKDRNYVARLYNRHTKSLQSLELEINVTSFLKSIPLSFEIPSFLPSQSGEAYVTLPGGTLGAIVSYIEGTAPALSTLKDAYSFGRIVGEISTRLGEYERPQSFDYEGIPFTDLYRLHPLADQESVASFWDSPPFPVTDEQKLAYNEALACVEEQRGALMELPRQLVHHDLLVFNLLSIDDVITGVLDFDFLAVDIAFLEFAISLNHVLQLSGGSLEMAAAFVEGYSAFRTGSSEEFRLLRTMTRLYHVAVLHIYIGQYRSGKDITKAFAYIANQLIERDNWLSCNAGNLERLWMEVNDDIS